MSEFKFSRTTNTATGTEVLKEDDNFDAKRIGEIVIGTDLSEGLKMGISWDVGAYEMFHKWPFTLKQMIKVLEYNLQELKDFAALPKEDAKDLVEGLQGAHDED